MVCVPPLWSIVWPRVREIRKIRNLPDKEREARFRIEQLQNDARRSQHIPADPNRFLSIEGARFARRAASPRLALSSGELNFIELHWAMFSCIELHWAAFVWKNVKYNRPNAVENAIKRIWKAHTLKCAALCLSYLCALDSMFLTFLYCFCCVFWFLSVYLS